MARGAPERKALIAQGRLRHANSLNHAPGRVWERPHHKITLPVQAECGTRERRSRIPPAHDSLPFTGWSGESVTDSDTLLQLECLMHS
jgi:hypothetical protein